MEDFDSGEVFAQILAAGRKVVRRVQSVVLPGDRLCIAVKDAERAAQRLHERVSLEGSKAYEREGGESGRVRRRDDLRFQLEGLVGLQKELAKDERKIGRLLENVREEEGPTLAHVDNEYADVRARFKGDDYKVFYAQGGCPSPPFSISDLAVHLVPEVMELLEKAKREAAEERVRSDLKAEFQRRLRVALVEEGAQKEVWEIIDDVLTTRPSSTMTVMLPLRALSIPTNFVGTI
uniref:Uncharacterized protein n=1 Tax=Chromera velia CCMP2878 TaxID=1169474 RepID=A0A0G4H922_9ALVE|eukprot:Cvel_25285.t1-p1 / transcript=Cvel_25285.t1 / gene=Cvel_25285 / organism=Chromera_velia_CCMP2878 / gene_product=hypothetical protein / transcript_product=hypothetical protein / location=Cvel_scaffold2840:17386-19535(+) / protein_length=234 / sequence_SO=supercontig / SO=protein_coding / is_pseudo=false